MKLNKIIILATILACILWIVCYSLPTSNKLEREAEPDIIHISGSDVVMNNAIEKAKQTLENFNVVLLNAEQNSAEFFLKVRFDTSNGGDEHIWIDSITIENNEYFGVVGNNPEYIGNVKLGQKVQINKEDISDWMYIKDGKTYGAYTVRVLREQMSKLEKEQFDKIMIFAE